MLWLEAWMAMAELDRRKLMGAALLGSVIASPASAASSSTAPSLPIPASTGTVRSDDEAYWDRIADQFDPVRSVIQLENGNWGMMARPVAEAHRRHLEMVNQMTSYYSRRTFGADARRIRARAAAVLGVDPTEIAFTRGATEALQALIGGYNRLRPGDQVLTADLDYDSMLTAMRWLKMRRGVDIVSIDLPETGVTYQGLIDVYEAALMAHPRVRMMLLTHVSHRTGLVLPVREIVAMARRHGVDVIVDAAHSWGQLAERPGDLGLDFAGFNGHKWIGAPLGIGILYIRKGRIGDIDPFMGNDEGADPDDILNRVHTGTTSLATTLALEDALAFHEAIGQAAKAGRLRFLRDRWAEALRDEPRIQILTPSDPRLAAAITSFRLKGAGTAPDNVALAKRLLDAYGIFTVHRTGVAGGACVRVTPALCTRLADVDALVHALRKIAVTA